jgi:flagellar basal body P-ring formation protein FlgA
MPRLRIALIIFLMCEASWSAALASAGSHADTHLVPMTSRNPGHRSKEAGFEHSVVRELPVELIRKTIQKYLEGEWGYRVKAVQVALLEPSDPTKIPPGVVELHVVPAPSEEGLGRRMFHVAVTTNGRPWKTIEALTDVAAMIDVVVPNRFLKSEELVDAEDLTVSRIRIHELKHPFITDRNEVIGKSTARPLQADTPLRPSFLKLPLMIKKGDRVMIEAKRRGLSIQTYGVTKSSGQVGQTIMVANLDSGRELRAKIVAPGLVQVEF